MIAVKILADSINPAGVRITSWLLTYPRFIHSEFMTHRIFSRNAASSRAIPFKKMIEAIRENPAFPEFWGTEQKGMQSGKQLPMELIQTERERGDGMIVIEGAKPDWEGTALAACKSAQYFKESYELHKSLCNRLIEPFAHITVLATATDHRNFFALRAHPDAMPEFQVLAYRMLHEYLLWKPEPLPWGAWHIPNFDPRRKILQIANPGDLTFVKIATARCARLSYLTFDGEHSPEKDIELHDRLIASGHLSPTEHCAQATNDDEYPLSNFDNPKWDSSSHCEPGLGSIEGLSHWRQYRKNFPEENRTNVDLNAILAEKPDWITL